MSGFKKKIGRFVFHLSWPFFWLYFKVWSQRTRIIVLYKDEILMLKGWLSDDSWGLPGGGAKKGEMLVQAAVRELREETGIIAKPSQFKHIANVPHGDSGLKYTAVYFMLRLEERATPSRQKGEIAEVKWCAVSELRGMKLNADARYATENMLPYLL